MLLDALPVFVLVELRQKEKNVGKLIYFTVSFSKLVSSWSFCVLFLIYLIRGTQQANICNLMVQFAEVTKSRIPAENLKRESTYFLLLLLHIMASQMIQNGKQAKCWWCMTYTNCLWIESRCGQWEADHFWYKLQYM